MNRDQVTYFQSLVNNDKEKSAFEEKYGVPFFQFLPPGDPNIKQGFAPISEQFQPLKDAANSGYNAMMEKAKSKEQVNPYGLTSNPLPGSPGFDDAMNEIYSEDNFNAGARYKAPKEEVQSVKTMTDEQRKSNNRGNDTSGPSDKQKKAGGKLPKELDKRGFFKKQWDKFTDKDSTAPRNLLDFGLAMMANSKGAGDDFLGTTAKSVSDTIDKADARKLSALETAKENRAAKLDEAKTTSEIYENIVKQNTKDFTDGDTGTKYSETDWNQVAISLREMDPDASFYSDNYLANIVDNKIGMPEYDEDNGFQITMDGDNQEQGFKVNQEIQSVVAMHGEKTDAQKKKVKVTLNGTQTTLYDIMRSESYQKSLNKTDNQNVNVNNLLSEVGQGNLTADQKAWVASGGKLEDFVGY